MRKLVLLLLTLLAACTPRPGRFCREDKPTSCWDIDLGAKTMTLVFPNGQSAPGSIPIEQGGDGFDYSFPAMGEARVQVKIIDRNTIGIRNSGASSPTFDPFVRR